MQRGTWLFVHFAKYCQCSELSEITMGMAFARIDEAVRFLRRLECNINAHLTGTAGIGGGRQWRTGAAL